MTRYRITTPLVAIRLPARGDDNRPGTISLPRDALLEVRGASSLGSGLVEITWCGEIYAVFERDLASKARVEPEEA
jgi:hypothetical protein